MYHSIPRWPSPEKRRQAQDLYTANNELHERQAMILSSPRSKRKLLVSEMLAIEVKRDALERELKQDDGGADSGNSGISLTEEQKVYLRRAR